ncbi:IS66 family insertion sequence element accessory protein TnpA [Methylomonas sp. LL1]|uniref:IS66 family insertion sequence element accessory protein TnpA n=1 Tax=Methylomonas sp. LL1 TaxID=2785785 RepID=UPI003FA5A6BE
MIFSSGIGKTITSTWSHPIDAWQRSGLLQAEYCKQQQINVRRFTPRLIRTEPVRLRLSLRDEWRLAVSAALTSGQF